MQSLRLGSESLAVRLKADRGQVGWCYMWLPSLWGGRGGGGGGGGGSCSSSLCCVAGASASMKESVERVLMRRGARRRRLLGVHGSLSWARSEGATMLLSSSASASHGGICTCAMGSRSGMKAGFSIPAGWKKVAELASTGFESLRVLEYVNFCYFILLLYYTEEANISTPLHLYSYG